ncbi:type II secretion system protein GspM [Aquipseudomonas ullengensis]|uniref:Type II secretion system protein M n=1 Tax=Aquipseudomonas ullengensis TaxID=2759166 RepID=A0A7W4LPJ3_9GAMM|nr:type II secretion system protein GspM [Pseudomonas ullengensis]MBB2496805.1 type II secretion system protein M [Pseudomonas ullengensis]
MNKLLQRWQGMVPREQWLTFGVGLALLGALYLLLVGDPLSTRLASQSAAIKLAEGRRLEAEAGLADLQGKLAADPNLSYRSALLAASASRDELVQQIERETAEMVTPEKMKDVLQTLLQSQPNLHLVGLQSFSEPVQLESASAADKAPADKLAVVPVSLYRHGLVLTLEGGFFDLLGYLQTVQKVQQAPVGPEGGGWKLNWESLDYQVGKAGPARAQISLKLYTLSSKAGWVGV